MITKIKTNYLKSVVERAVLGNSPAACGLAPIHRKVGRSN